MCTTVYYRWGCTLSRKTMGEGKLREGKEKRLLKVEINEKVRKEDKTGGRVKGRV
jgi:hypothetical protein